MIPSTTPAGLFNLGRVEADAAVARDAAAPGDAVPQGNGALSFASLLMALLGGGAETPAQAPNGAVDAGEGVSEGTEAGSEAGQVPTEGTQGSAVGAVGVMGAGGAEGVLGESGASGRGAPMPSAGGALSGVGTETEDETTDATRDRAGRGSLRGLRHRPSPGL